MATATTNAFNINKIDAILASDLNKFKQLTASCFASNVAVVDDVIKYLISSGGKKIRAKLALLSARAIHDQENTEVCEAAVVLESIHAATLLHDDVVDSAELRRKHRAARIVWGNEISVLVGDFMYAKAFQLLATRDNIPLMHLLAKTTAQLSEGEVLQLSAINENSLSDASLAKYIEIISAKTGALFAASTQAGAMIASPNNAALQQQLYTYGLKLGIAFQIQDDMLDYTASSKHTGKTIGQDLSEGKITLPMLYAKQACSATERHALQQALNNNNFDAVIEIMHKYKVFDRCQAYAAQYIQTAKLNLADLKPSKYKQALEYLADFAIQRNI